MNHPARSVATAPDAVVIGKVVPMLDCVLLLSNGAWLTPAGHAMPVPGAALKFGDASTSAGLVIRSSTTYGDANVGLITLNQPINGQICTEEC